MRNVNELNTILYTICNTHEDSIDLIALENVLVEGAQTNALFIWEEYALQTGERESLFPCLHLISKKRNAVEAAQKLLDFGADIQQIDPHTGNTVLLTAISNANIPYVLFLIDYIKAHATNSVKALLNQKDHKKPNWLKSPLILTLKKGLDELTEKLVEADADVRIPDRQGLTPLHWACMWRKNSLIKLFLEHGADKTALTAQSRTAQELYQYEFGLLDQPFCLAALNNSGSAIFKTRGFFADFHFHGQHRKDNRMDESILILLEAIKIKTPTMEQEYLTHFFAQDAIARWATYLPTSGGDYLLRLLKLEGVRIYGEQKMQYLPEIADTGKTHRPEQYDLMKVQAHIKWINNTALEQCMTLKKRDAEAKKLFRPQIKCDKGHQKFRGRLSDLCSPHDSEELVSLSIHSSLFPTKPMERRKPSMTVTTISDVDDFTHDGKKPL